MKLSFCCRNDEDRTVLLSGISERCKNVLIPSTIDVNGIKYKVAGVNDKVFMIQEYKRAIFESDSPMRTIPISFIRSFKHGVELGRNTARIVFDSIYPDVFFQVVIPSDNKYFTSIGDQVILTNHPLELTYYKKCIINLIIRESTKIIGDFSCQRNEHIRGLILPQSVEIIGHGSFSDCNNLRFISFSPISQLKIIGRNAFKSTNITKIRIPRSVEIIFSMAFYNSKIRILEFQTGSKLNEIGRKAFKDTYIEKVTIPSSVEIIEDLAFNNCRNLQSVVFYKDSTLKIIGTRAFIGTAIQSISLPDRIEVIEEDAFEHNVEVSRMTG